MYAKWWGAAISISYVLCFIYLFIFIKFHLAVCGSGWPTEMGRSETVRPSAVAKDKIRRSKHSPTDRSPLLCRGKKHRIRRFCPTFSFSQATKEHFAHTLQSQKVKVVCRAYQVPEVKFRVVSKVITSDVRSRGAANAVSVASSLRWDDGKINVQVISRCAGCLAAAMRITSILQCLQSIEIVFNVQCPVIKREMRKHLFEVFFFILLGLLHHNCPILFCPLIKDLLWDAYITA